MLALPSRLAVRQLALLARTGNRSALNSVRFNSAMRGSASTSPLIAGIAGGTVVLVGGYAIYHLSGTPKNATVTPKDVAKSPPPLEVITYLRNVTKSYLYLIPGASRYIDAFFDRLDKLHRTHKDEVEAIANKTYQEVRKVIQDGEMDIATASKIFSILKAQSAELRKIR